MAVSNKPPKLEKLNYSWTTLGAVQFVKPAALDEDTSIRKEHANLLEQNSFAELRTLPDVCPEFSWDKLHIKSQIIENVKEKSKLLNSGKSALQEELLIIASNYHVCLKYTFVNDYFLEISNLNDFFFKFLGYLFPRRNI